MIETMGLGAGSYPEAPEYEERTLKAKVMVTYEIETEIPASWDDETIEDDIRSNLDDYINGMTCEINEIEL